MLCRDIMLHTCRLLNLKNVEAELLIETTEFSDEYLKLLRCVNLVLSEITEEYVPQRVTQEFETEERKILYSKFSFPPSKIYSVKDEQGYTLRFSKMQGGILLNAEKAVVTYSYILPALSADDSVNLDLISMRTIAYGVMAEYYILSNRYEEGAMYAKRFKGSLRNISELSCKKTLPQRRLF